MTVLANEELLRAFAEKVAMLERHLECAQLQVTKYEVLSRTRGQRIGELEATLVDLQRILETQMESIAALATVKQDAEVYMETILSQNAELKRENVELRDVRAELVREQKICQQLESRYHDLIKGRNRFS